MLLGRILRMISQAYDGSVLDQKSQEINYPEQRAIQPDCQ